MGWRSTRSGYGLVPVALHWLMLVLVAAAYATMEFKSAFPKGSEGRAMLALWHYGLGLSVFGLVWLRLLVRLAGDEPAIEPPLPAWQARAARAMHWVLYALMIGLPLFGWLAISAKGTPVAFFGMALPALVGEDKALAKVLKEIHEAAATAGYGLVGLHAAAALLHHYILRDNTLKLMLGRR